MNERIRELSDIAYKNHLARNPDSSFGRRSDYDREFADLIVRECVEVCFAVHNAHDGDYVLAKWCAEGIQKHFGVKE